MLFRKLSFAHYKSVLAWLSNPSVLHRTATPSHFSVLTPTSIHPPGTGHSSYATVPFCLHLFSSQTEIQIPSFRESLPDFSNFTDVPSLKTLSSWRNTPYSWLSDTSPQVTVMLYTASEYAAVFNTIQTLSAIYIFTYLNSSIGFHLKFSFFQGTNYKYTPSFSSQYLRS